MGNSHAPSVGMVGRVEGSHKPGQLYTRVCKCYPLRVCLVNGRDAKGGWMVELKKRRGAGRGALLFRSAVTGSLRVDLKEREMRSIKTEE